MTIPRPNLCDKHIDYVYLTPINYIITCPIIVTKLTQYLSMFDATAFQMTFQSQKSSVFQKTIFNYSSRPAGDTLILKTHYYNNINRQYMGI